MRWHLSLLVPLSLLLFQATDSDAQEVPVTVTLAADNNAVTGVEFPEIAPGRVLDRPSEGRVQYLVGFLGPDHDGMFRTRIRYFTGAGSHAKRVMFASEATCSEGTSEGAINRIACAVLENGAGVVCSATYGLMNAPPETCTGTYACIRCAGGVKVCGANPECAN